ncbi:MAG: hypothetical protein J3K34DRAFT_153726 [Monoraphidium minutum]|nr:MAG: hypothetical protein J3K34DRAFT_153726 [Monoraphidium minutum]
MRRHIEWTPACLIPRAACTHATPLLFRCMPPLDTLPQTAPKRRPSMPPPSRAAAHVGRLRLRAARPRPAPAPSRRVRHTAGGPGARRQPCTTRTHAFQLRAPAPPRARRASHALTSTHRRGGPRGAGGFRRLRPALLRPTTPERGRAPRLNGGLQEADGAPAGAAPRMGCGAEGDWAPEGRAPRTNTDNRPAALRIRAWRARGAWAAACGQGGDAGAAGGRHAAAQGGGPLGPAG